MAKQTFTTGQVLTAAQMTSLQETAMGGGPATAKTASYVLVAADAGTTVAMNAAGATTITVNTGLFAAGDTVFIQNLGAGACTVTAGTATVATAGSLILPQNDAGNLYFTATGAAIFYDYIQAGAVSPLTTKGDLYTFSTSDARLGVGANGTTLVADSSTATGLKWATPASGGGITLLSTTSLSGASTTISSISQDYNYLYGIVSKCTNDTADGKLTVAPNNTTAQYSAGVRKSGTSTVENMVTNNTAMPLSLDAVIRRNDTDNTFSFFIYDYTNTDTGKWKNFFILSSFVHTGGTYVRAGSAAGPITGQAAITSLVFANSGGSFLEGTVQLYGVK
jgi:hypothetical protein